MCRLRRKNDYHAMNCTNGDFQLSDSLASSGTYLGCGIDPLTSTSREDKMAECSFKKSSSSHDSHSVEQTDSPSQSDWKTKDEIDEARFVSPVNVCTSSLCYFRLICMRLGCIYFDFQKVHYVKIT